MDKFEFMEMVKGILEDIDVENLDSIGEQMKSLIDNAIELEKQYNKAGIR